MSFEVLATMIAKALRSAENRRVEFIWHGGEPLLLGQEFYQKALYLQNEFRTEGQMIRNSLQTNGTLLSDEWCEFFKENDFHIGISFDGPEILHNQNRVYASGKGSFEDVRNGVALLQKHQLPFGALMVLNHEALKLHPEDIFNFFFDMGIKAFSFLPARPDNLPGTGENPTTDYVTSSEFANFMKQVFDIWIELDDPSIQIREFTSITKALAGGLTSICTLAGHCLGQYYHVEFNGDLYHCDKYLGDTDYHVGNILADEFLAVSNSQKMQDLRTNESNKINSLMQCKWFHICNGGCPHDRYIAEKYSEDYDSKCCGMHDLIEYIHNNIEEDLSKVMTIPSDSMSWV